MASQKIAEAVGLIVGAVADLEPPDQEKALSAARVVLGVGRSDADPPRDNDDKLDGAPDLDLGKNAKRWIKTYKISDANLEQFFDIDGGSVSVLTGPLPGNTNSKKSINCYLILGVSSLLENDSPEFNDKDARSLCEDFGCYDGSNHSKIDFGNWLAGSKSTGWKLTAPGLKQAAEVITSVSEDN